MLSLDDTIAAISTPLGEGGIGIVRLSGPDARSILESVFVRTSAPLPPRRLTYGHVVDPTDGSLVDECLVAYLPAPRTYTRQDMAEIQAHGGPVPLRRILELCLRQGARLASPGEFTVRAFLNGRIDLAQAEAVLDVVRARTEAGLRVAVEQLGGRLSGEVRTVRRALLDVLAYLEASIDFGEAEVPPRDVGPALDQAARQLETLLAGADQGIVLRQGVRVAIVGRPNVGKSSLLNALLRVNRAIVTPIPGTTRDTLEETINLGGVPFVLIDTAGIDQTDDLVERLGVERSRKALTQADLALVVVDGSQPLEAGDLEIAAAVNGRPAILVVNKIDLVTPVAGSRLRPFTAFRAGSEAQPEGLQVAGSEPSNLEPSTFQPSTACHLVTLSPCHLVTLSSVAVSALTGQGLAELEQAMVELALGGQVVPGQAPLVSHPRHKAALGRALDAVRAAAVTHRQGLPADFVAIDLTAAVEALGEITGETASEDLLDAIFSQFCVGK
jgi:tRNA modification GTPase